MVEGLREDNYQVSKKLRDNFTKLCGTLAGHLVVDDGFLACDVLDESVRLKLSRAASELGPSVSVVPKDVKFPVGILLVNEIDDIKCTDDTIVSTHEGMERGKACSISSSIGGYLTLGLPKTGKHMGFVIAGGKEQTAVEASGEF